MKREELLERVKQTIHEIEPDADIILYGSRARGDAHPESDWDFLILLPGVLFKRNESLVLCLGLGPLGDSDQKVLRLQAYQGEQEKRRNKKCKDLCVHKFPPGCISMPDSCSYLITNISPAAFSDIASGIQCTGY